MNDIPELGAPEKLVKPSLREEINDLAVNLFNLIENQITRADTKAGLIIAADTVLATGASLWSKSTIVNLLNDAMPFNVRASAFFTLMTFGALLCSTLFALMVARPVMKAHETGGTLFFFGRISQMTYDDFAAKFASQSPDEFRQSLLTEVYTTARLARKKFLRIRYSLDFLIAAVFLWGMVQIVAAVSN
ncbi:MAG: hypothetical protein HZB51_23535 [Chloroflexi bacterium]|nr:hypothetical protein [Chloroflexota bacterium]